jgi:hypothetical protein
MSARAIEGIELSSYSGFDAGIYKLQRQLLDSCDLRQKFNDEWRELCAVYLENGAGKSEAITKAIHNTRDRWLNRT